MTAKETLQKSTRGFYMKWSIAFKITPIILLIVCLRFLSRYYDFDVLELNALFTSLVAGTIFLIGFLISGVLSDYKESEKLPNELTASIKSLIDDNYTIYRSKDSKSSVEFYEFQKKFVDSVFDWFYKHERTHSILEKLSGMNHFFAEFDKEGIQPAYIIRMKNEQSNIRKMILRIDTIRDTNFIGSAYAIVEGMGIAISIGLILIKMEPFYASLFFTTLVSGLIFYMIKLIKDLDNPFDYSNMGETGTEIPLKPIKDLKNELSASRQFGI